ncbi:MAG: carbohydrate-binding protein [Lentisphaeria bacterium]|nr:carbohydrate-binding protein [Lentisphaeria bacterium]
MLKRNLLAVFAAFAAGTTVLIGADEPSGVLFHYDFSRGGAPELKQHAKIANGVLSLDGKDDYALVPESENMHFAEKGMTLAATVKLNYSETDPSVDNRMDMFFSKGKEFIFGKSGTSLYFNFHNGKRWCANLLTREGAVPESGKWAHVAVTVSYEKDWAQGDFGYRISIYLNGEKEAGKRVSMEEPVQTKEPIELGRGFGGGPWFMNGEFADVIMFDRPLSPDEIADLCSQDPRVKVVRKGFVEIQAELKEREDRIRAQGKAAAQWLADALLRAASGGYDQQALTAIADFTEQHRDDDLEKLKEKFDRSSLNCRILLTSDLAAAVLTGRGTGAHPVIGVLNRRTGKEIFGERTLCWEILWTRGREKGEIPYNGRDVVWESELSGNTVSVVWKGKGDIPFTARSEVRFAGPRLESTFELKNESDCTFESVRYPLYAFRHLGEGDTLVHPRMSGMLAQDPTEEPFRGGAPAVFPSGSATMQFGAYYNAAKDGIYFGYEDGLARTKAMLADGRRKNLIIGWENPLIVNPGKNRFKLNGKAVVELYRGQWYEAGQIYRRFLEKEAAWWIPELPRKSTPEWFRNNTLSMKFCTRGEREAEDIRDAFLYLRGYFELPFAGHWYYWNDQGKMGYPHFPIKDFVLRINRELQKGGIYTIPYIDDLLWKINDGPDNTDYMYTSHGYKYAIKDQRGEVYKEDYGKNEVYVKMCPYVREWQDVMLNLVKQVSDYGFSGIYHDQVGTAMPRACYDPSHGHLLNDSSLWLEKGYWPMFDRFFAYLHTHHPDCGHTTEENAEPYLKQFDGYVVCRWLEDNQIPLYQSIYSGRAQFVGRLFNFPRPGDKQSFFSILGQQLVNAEQLGRFYPSEMYEPDDRRLFTKKAMHIRLALLDWFNEGRMLAPIDFGGTMKMEHALWGGYVPQHVTMPVIANSAWEDKDGTRMWLFVNTQMSDESSAVPVIESEKGFWICREGAEAPVFSQTACPVKLKPLHTEVWVEGSREKAEAVQTTLRKIASFDKGKSIRTVLKFARIKITGIPDHLYTAKDRSDNMYCNAASDDSHIGYIQDGALIAFGTVDFGTDGARSVTVNAAVDPAYAGGSIQLLTAVPGQPETEVAVIPLKSTGGWGNYEDFTVLLKVPLTGKHRICFRVNGNAACNFKGWKYGR